MIYKHYPYDIPDVILLVGTDASGKDHVAHVLETHILALGGSVEKRKRFFSGKVTHERSSTNKGWSDRLQESVFLAVYPWLGSLLVWLIGLLTLLDARRFRAPRGKLIVVGHNGLRALAFVMAHRQKTKGRHVFPRFLRHVFAVTKRMTKAHVVVLDVHPDVRRRRILQRSKAGETDLFDRFMLQDPARSEKIEACLIEAATKLMRGRVMINDDLHVSEIKKHILEEVHKD